MRGRADSVSRGRHKRRCDTRIILRETMHAAATGEKNRGQNSSARIRSLDHESVGQRTKPIWESSTIGKACLIFD